MPKRKIIVNIATSADGYVARTDGNLDWLTKRPAPKGFYGLEELAEPYRTMVLIAACLGLRAGEIIGLQWGDLNWEDRTLLVRRSVVQGRVGDTKTEASQLPLPIAPGLGDALRVHWQRSLHREAHDWLFANREGKPRWQESILRRYIKPAAVRAGVGKVGWHTGSAADSGSTRCLGTARP